MSSCTVRALASPSSDVTTCSWAAGLSPVSSISTRRRRWAPTLAAFLAKPRSALRCNFVDGPNPLILDNVLGTLRVQASELSLEERGPALVVLAGFVDSEWIALSPEVGVPRRRYRISLELEATFRI